MSQQHFRRSQIAWAALLMGVGAVSGCVSSGGTPRLGHDFNGIWNQDQGVLYSDPTKGVASGRHPGYDETKNPPPLTQEYAAKYQAIKDAAARGEAVNDRTANCSPPGVPRLIVNPYPNEFIQTPKQLTIATEYLSQVRRIYLDGRKHPDPEDDGPLYNGHSIGHFEGDTLVVETVQLRGDTAIQSTGLPHSDKLTVVERIRLLSPDKLEDQVTMIDPEAFTRPYVSVRTFTRMKNYEIKEYVCTNNRSYVDKNGRSQIQLQKH